MAVGVDLGEVGEELRVVAVDLNRNRTGAGQHEDPLGASVDVLRQRVLRGAEHLGDAAAGDLALRRLRAHTGDDPHARHVDDAESDEDDGEMDAAMHAKGWARRRVSWHGRASGATRGKSTKNTTQGTDEKD